MTSRIALAFPRFRSAMACGSRVRIARSVGVIVSRKLTGYE